MQYITRELFSYPEQQKSETNSDIPVQTSDFVNQDSSLSYVPNLSPEIHLYYDGHAKVYFLLIIFGPRLGQKVPPALSSGG